MSAATRLQTAWLERGVIAWLLLPWAWLYFAALVVRKTLYRTGLKRTVEMPVPVIVVGNLIAGGAGKTPTVMALINRLREHGWTPAIVSRGYGRQSKHIVLVNRTTPATEAGDEPLLMHLRTGAPVVVASDRVAAAKMLLNQHPEVNMLITDDGLQHWRLARNAQIIVFDERGAGNGWLLPAGPLREPMPAQTPPHSLVLYNAPAPSTWLPGHVITRRLSGAVSLSEWWQGQPARPERLTTLRGRTVVAAAGVARAERFFEMLRILGLVVIELPLPDHHDFQTLPWPAGTADVIVTEKDAVKLAPGRIEGSAVWVATLDFAFPPPFELELLGMLPAAPRTPIERNDNHGHPTA
jgi:tetraacyldisaccharide 4'-kinase